MCGIIGVLWTDERKAIAQSCFDRMVDTLTHRGPDDRGTAFLPLDSNGGDLRCRGIALGHRRLSIIDLSEQGRQPLCNEDGSIWITFNGEIYNYLELKPDLERKGHHFRTETDTEVLVHLYEEYGLRFVDYLNGMFALAIWDGRQRRLVLARDRMGKKPFFYRKEKNRFLFASELKALLAAPDVPRELDPIALDQYLTYQYVPHPRSIYQGIFKLPPGHLAVLSESPDSEAASFSDDSLLALTEDPNDTRLRSNENSFFTEEDPNGLCFVVRPYWRPDCRLDKTLSFEEGKREVRRRLENAVRLRMRSDVPLGAFLSGGVDSSIIAGIMQSLSSRRIKTFSIGFAQKEYNETEYSRRTAQRLGTEHEEFFVEPDAEAIFPQLVCQYDEPFSDSSALPTWYLSELTRTKVTVALSGDGGDELFAGYDRYKAVRLGSFIDRVPFLFRKLLAGPVRAMIPASVRQRSLLRRGKRFLEALTMSPAERYLQWIAIFNRQRKLELYQSDYFRQFSESARLCHYDILDFLTEAGRYSASRDPATSISLTDLLTYLPGDLMTKVDIASMRHSLEVRAPFLDRDLIDLAARLPIEYKIRGRKGKFILREAFRDYLPPDLENRPKTGFGVPLDHWFRGPLKDLVHEILLSPSVKDAGIFDPKYIRRLYDEHCQKKFDHSARLWSLLVFQYWYQQ